MQHNSRPHPHVDIPPGARPPTNPSPSAAWVPYIYDHNDSPAMTPTPTWQDNSYLSPQTPFQSHARAPRSGSLSRPASFSEGYHAQDESLWQFPEPQIQRSISQQSSYRPSPLQHHRQAKSDVGKSAAMSMERISSQSSDELTSENSVEDLSEELSSMTLESEEGLRRFQAGELSPADEEWHRLVPETAREALGKREVQRQSVIFEVFKSEREYVGDLEAFREVFIEGLPGSGVIREDQLRDFVKEVFWNLDEIIAIHQRMLASLLERQREQHPLIQSVSDIVLETVLIFRNSYESYIKHYPISEARHRSELKRNPKYQEFAQKCMQDRRIKKRDLVTFISRPVTRLPRLMLVLEHIHQLTEPDHPDLETMPLILSILSDFVKSTQPGIESAEGKVKFWSLCDSLVYRKGELIDMDLYDDSRTLIHSGTLARRQRSEIDWHGWNDYVVALLDNYLVLTRAETRSSGNVKHVVVSRPIPLVYLRLGQFDSPPENRKERADDGRLLESLRFHLRPMYPFTVYHAAAKSARRYTFYSTSEAGRKKWHDVLVDALGVHRVRQEANQWFAPNSLNDGSFKARTALVPASSNERFTGKISAATPFSSGGRNFLAVGCETGGIYVGLRGNSEFRKVLRLTNPSSMAALQEHNKIVIFCDGALSSYSLDLLARVSQGQAPAQSLEASLETIAGQDGGITFFRAGFVANRTIVVYAHRSFRQTTVHALEVVKNPSGPRRTGGSLSYQSFGNPFYVPRQAYDMTPMTRTVAISTDKGVTIVDPTNLSSSSVLVIPDFSGVASTDERYTSLKSRCDTAKPLGVARSEHDEILVIYEEFGCYVTRHGVPCRSFSFTRWECKATAFAHRGAHILLFSPEFVEIRNVATGRLVQVIEGRDVRLLHSGPPVSAPVLIAMRGKTDDRSGLSDEILELVETTAIVTPGTPAPGAVEGIWDEWDM